MHVPVLASDLVGPCQDLERLDLILLAASVGIEDLQCLEAAPHPVADLAEVEVQQGQLQEDDTILWDGCLVVLFQDLLGLQVLL